MTRSALLMIFLAAWAVLTPVVEAVEICQEVCPQDGAAGECPDDGPCCSCCVHVRGLLAPPLRMDASTSCAPRSDETELPPLSAAPRRILHVPKAS